MSLVATPGGRLFRTTARDGWVLAGTLLHAGGMALLLAAVATAPLPVRALGALLLAVGLCWAANTVAHVHLHTPIFTSARANCLLTLLQTLALGIPLSWWRARHLAHHGVLPFASPAATRAAIAREAALIVAGWLTVAIIAPGVAATYLVAWALGLGLCVLQGHYEHPGGGPDDRVVDGFDHHGRLYNRLWFNDGHHAQHHRAPDAHWTQVPRVVGARARVSAWPPLLGWLRWAHDLTGGSLSRLRDRCVAGALDRLERVPLHFSLARRLVLAAHGRAFARLLPVSERPSIRRVCIVGGALFPRTALILRRLLPDADLVIVDGAAAHVAVAQRLLHAAAPVGGRGQVSFLTARYDPAAPPPGAAADLVIVPLAFRGDRRRFYATPPAPRVIVHDWLWRRRGAAGRIVSWWLLKRINLVRQPIARARLVAGFGILRQETTRSPAPPSCLTPLSSSIVTCSRGSPGRIGKRF